MLNKIKVLDNNENTEYLKYSKQNINLLLQYLTELSNQIVANKDGKIIAECITAIFSIIKLGEE